MAKVVIEAKADPAMGFVTSGQVNALITEAQLMGAPPDAEIGFDAVMEFRTPVRARRVTITWER
jgi:hypothetical protein